MKDLDYLILEALKKDNDYSSGEELAQKLGVRRQTLWKHISKLTDKGYEIVAVPHLGYRLNRCPDKFYPWEIQYNLNTKFIAKEVYPAPIRGGVYYEEVAESTQDIAWELGLKGAPEGTVVFSQTQKKGRGRLLRKWISPRGGIYFSLLLRPKFLLIQEVPQITLLISLGCLYGIKKATAITCSLKWPNDLYLGGKKLGGVLCEMHAEMDKVHFVVVGVGINVNTENLPPKATSLFLNRKKKLSCVEIAKSILEEIEACYLRAQEEGFTLLLKEWEKFHLLRGERVRAKVFNKEIEGEARGIDEQGYLLLRKINGSIEKISAGDVVKVD